MRAFSVEMRKMCRKFAQNNKEYVPRTRQTNQCSLEREEHHKVSSNQMQRAWSHKLHLSDPTAQCLYWGLLAKY